MIDASRRRLADSHERFDLGLRRVAQAVFLDFEIEARLEIRPEAIAGAAETAQTKRCGSRMLPAQ